MEEKNMDRPVDHISELPVPVLQKILSSFLAKDVAQLSTLSKYLNSAWSSLSYLNFGSKFFYHQGDDDQWILSENITELVNVVDQILANRQNQKISIRKFWLTLPSSRWSCYIHGWINTLVSLNIKELILSVDTPDDSYNTLPEAIFAAKELNVLKLQGFKLELPHDGIKFSSLRVLHLSKALLSEHFIRAVCESCSGLEDLTLNECGGLASLQIVGTLPKLRSVWLKCLYNLQMVDIIAASNLENLHIDWMSKVIEITACKSLKRLYLHHVRVTDEVFQDIFSSLPNLEDLCLLSCRDQLETIKISSERLVNLDVSFCYNLINIELHTPNLTSFSYACLNKLPTLKLKASALLKVRLYLFRVETLDSHWYSELLRFLGCFKQSKGIVLGCDNEKAIVIPKNTRKNLVPPLYDTDCMHIEFRSAEENYSVLDVLDSLRWICPQLDTVCFVRRSLGLKSTLKFLYDLKYWKNKLKDVKMDNFTCMEQQELRNYLFKKENASE